MEQLLSVLSYYPVALTAIAIGFIVQGVKLGVGAFGRKLDKQTRSFVYQAAAFALGALAALPPGWLSAQGDAAPFVERFGLGMAAAAVSSLAYPMLRKRFPALSGGGDA